jgi:hypothetical protein
MGITNTIPPSRLIQPGVIDNAAARPASPFEGQCIFQKDTDQLLVWNGTAWVIPNSPAQNPTGLELVKTQTFTSSSSIDVDNCFSSNFDNYRVVVQWLQNTTTTISYLKFKDSGGVVSTAYASRSNGSYRTGGANIFSEYLNDNALTATVGIFIGSVNSSARGYATFDVLSPNLAQQTNLMGQFMTTQYSTNTLINVMLGGWQDSTTSMVGMNLYPSGGTMTGVVSVYGYRK